MKSETQGYTKISIGMHWLIALMVLTIFSVGLYMVTMPISPQKLRIYSWHKWTGITIFIFMILRLSWKVAYPPSPMPEILKPWEKSLAGAVHILLYVLVFIIPVSGWLMSSASGYKVVYLGILALPDLIDKNKDMVEFYKWLHQYLNFTLLTAVILHISGAVKHLIIDRDIEAMRRMIPVLRRGDGR